MQLPFWDLLAICNSFVKNGVHRTTPHMEIMKETMRTTGLGEDKVTSRDTSMRIGTVIPDVDCMQKQQQRATRD